MPQLGERGNVQDHCGVLVAQLGARRHYAVPRVLHRAGLLEMFVTDACANVAPWRWLAGLAALPVGSGRLRSLLGRSVPEVPAERIVGFPLFVLNAQWDRRKGELQTDRWVRRNKMFCDRVVRNGFGGANWVYAFNGAALEIFRAAKDKGVQTVLDQTAAPWRWNGRLLKAEMERWPGWEDSPAEIDTSGALMEREEAEWELADVIICGSQFCRDALVESGVTANRCHILPNPTAGSRVTGVVAGEPKSNRNFRVLFAGTLQLRKGIQYLYSAAQALRGETVEFRVVGPSLLSEPANRQLAEVCDVIGAVPRSRMVDHYRWADVLVLPTLSEGSANVCHEAMAAGLPVITTRAAGSRLQDGINGLLVPEKDAEALVEAIVRMARDPEARRRFGEAARNSVNQARDAGVYPQRLRALLEGVPTEPRCT